MNHSDLKSTHASEGVYFKLSHSLADSGRWGHCPRRGTGVGVTTNPRQFEMYPGITVKYFPFKIDMIKCTSFRA
jgi:hypothetical protein